MSRLLLDEEPLLIMPGLAVKVGLNEAIILQQIHYWLKINRRDNKNYINDKYWTYNTYEEWKKQFPFWSTSTIKRSIYKLEKLGLVISTSDFNKLSIDKTKWYTIDYEKLDKIEAEPTCQNDTTSVQNATSQNETQDGSKRNVQRIKKKHPSVQNERAIPKTTSKTTKENKNKTIYNASSKKSNFNNFPQRQYDFNKLEKGLLGIENVNIDDIQEV